MVSTGVSSRRSPPEAPGNRSAAGQPPHRAAPRRRGEPGGDSGRERDWLVVGSLAFPAMAVPWTALALALETGPGVAWPPLAVAAVVTIVSGLAAARCDPELLVRRGWLWTLPVGYTALAIGLNLWGSHAIALPASETGFAVFWPLLQGSVTLWLALYGRAAALLAVAASLPVSLAMIMLSGTTLAGAWLAAPFVGWLLLALGVADVARIIMRNRTTAAPSQGVHAGERAEDGYDRRRMHDTALQAMEGIALLSSATNPDDAERLRVIREMARAEATRMRDDIEGRVPQDLGDELASLVAFSRALGLPVSLETVGVLPISLPARVHDACQGAVLEALTNARQHASAANVTVRLTAATHALVVEVVDDGVGFAADLAGAGFGLRESIVARVQEAGGEVEIRSRPGAGTTVAVRFGWPASPAEGPPDPRRSLAGHHARRVPDSQPGGGPA